MIKRTAFASLAGLLMIFGGTSPTTSARQQSNPASARYVAGYNGRFLAAAAAIAGAGGAVVADLSQIGVIIADSANPDFASALSTNTDFSYVVQDQEVQWLPGVEVPEDDLLSMSDPAPAPAPVPPLTAFFLPLQWNIPVTQTDLAWGITTGSSAVKVAVLDTGICPHHQDTIGKVDFAESASFVTEPASCGPAVAPACVGCPSWEDRHFHGTHVGGTISSNNHGTAGIAPNVRLRAVKVLNCTGSGSFSGVIGGIIYAVNTGNDVINMSLGAGFPKNVPGGGQLVAAMNKAVNFAQTQGVLVASAAGNAAIDLDHDGNLAVVPCQSGSGMCVGSTTRSDALSSFSNHGLSGPQITAPGGGLPVAPFFPTIANRFILAPCSKHSTLIPICGTPPQFYLFVSGTSMATPHVAGAAALADSVAPRGPGSRRASQLRSALLQGADDLWKPGADNTYSHGRLNVFKAVQ